MSKTFSTIEMKRKGAAKLQKKLNGMDLEAELKFWQECTKKLKNVQDRLIKNQREHRKIKRQTNKTV